MSRIVSHTIFRSFLTWTPILFIQMGTAGFVSAQGTYTSVSSGNWSDHTIWSENAVPTASDDVVIASGHTVSFDGVLTMRNLTINAGGTVTDVGQPVTITGDFNVNGIYAGIGEIRLTGSGSTIGGTGMITNTNNLVIEGNKIILATAQLSKTAGDLQINGAYTVTNHGSVNVSGNINGGEIVLMALWVNAENSTLAMGGNLGINVQLDASAPGNTIAYTGSVMVQLVPRPLDGQYANLALSGTSYKLLPSDPISLSGNYVNDCAFVLYPSGHITFNGTTNISGSYDASFPDVVITGTLIASPRTLLISGNLTNGGTFLHGGGTLQFSGTGAVQINGNPLILNNVNLDLLKTVRNNTAVELRGVMNLSALATFEANGAGVGTLTLRSFSESTAEDASIGPLLNNARITGRVTVERYMRNAPRIYRYLSSPVKDATLAQWNDDFLITGNIPGLQSLTMCGYRINVTGPSIYYYDETAHGDWGNGYMPFPAAGGAGLTSLIQPGRGYATYIRNCKETLIDVTGEINQGNVSYSFVRYTESDSPYDGWNLVGNPYPSAIDWSKPTGWSRVNIASVAAVTRNTPNGETQFEYCDSAPNEFGQPVPGNVIASGQGFWVRAVGPGVVLTVNENAKTRETGSFYREAMQGSELVITLTNGTVTDRAFIRYRPFAEAVLDAYDGPKLPNATFDVFTYSNDGVELAVNSTPSLGCDEPIKVGVRSLEPGEYTMTLDALGKYSPLRYELHDAFTGRTTSLEDLAYQFVVTNDPASSAESRFTIVARETNADVAPALEYPSTVCEPAATITITNATEGGVYEFYTAGDSLIASVTSAGTLMQFDVPASVLTTGENRFRVKRVPVCAATQESIVTINVEGKPSHWSAIDGKTCGEGSAQLTVTGISNTDHVKWYSRTDDKTPINEGNTFNTGLIGKDATYYAEVTSEHGCVSDRVPVRAEVVYVTEPEIANNDDELKITSGDTARWFFEDQPLGIMATITPDRNGVYTAEVIQNGCTARASYTHLVAETGKPAVYQGFPNPFVDYIVIADSDEPVKSVNMLDVSGVEIALGESPDGHNGRRYDTSALPRGVYVLVISYENKKIYQKMMKN